MAKTDRLTAALRKAGRTASSVDVAHACERSAVSLTANPQRVLIVEDNPRTAEVLSNQLRQAGHAVTVALGARDIRVALEEQGITAAVIDLVLVEGPHVTDGLEVGRMIRSDFPEVAVSYVTGYAARLPEVDELGTVFRKRGQTLGVQWVAPSEVTRWLRSLPRAP